MYWFTRDIFAQQVRVHLTDWDLENMDAFLAMSRNSELRRIAAELEGYEGGRYSAFPGEYLELTVENGLVTAQIHLCDAIPCRLTVQYFCRLVTEYLEQWEILRRELAGEHD